MLPSSSSSLLLLLLLWLWLLWSVEKKKKKRVLWRTSWRALARRCALPYVAAWAPFGGGEGLGGLSTGFLVVWMRVCVCVCSGWVREAGGGVGMNRARFVWSVCWLLGRRVVVVCRDVAAGVGGWMQATEAPAGPVMDEAATKLQLARLQGPWQRTDH